MHEFLNDPHHDLKLVGDVVSAAISALTLATWLPNLAGAFSVAWFCTRFYEYAKSKLK